MRPFLIGGDWSPNNLIKIYSYWEQIIICLSRDMSKKHFAFQMPGNSRIGELVLPLIYIEIKKYDKKKKS